MRMPWKAIPSGDPFAGDREPEAPSPGTKAILVFFLVVGVVLAGFAALLVAIAALAT